MNFVFLKHKQTSLLCLAILLIIFSFAGSTELRVVGPSSIATVGDTVVVRILINDIYDLFGAGFDLSYNPSQLEYVKVIEGSFLSSNHHVNTIFLVTNNQAEGQVMAGITRSNYQDGGASSIGDTILLSIRFRVTDADSSPLTIASSSLIAPDGVTKYPHTVVNGFVVSEDQSGVDDLHEMMTKPSEFVLGNAFPNPFNSSTSISCYNSSRENGDICIINILGKRVCTIFSGELGVGENTFTWDGRDLTGKSVSSGIYNFVFHIGSLKQSKKIILLK